MTLPSSLGGSTTETVGFFDIGSDVLAEWLRRGLGQGLGQRWRLSRPRWPSAAAALAALLPALVPSRYACIPLGKWTVLLNNTPLGTDVGILPIHATREFGITCIRATCVSDERVYPARVLEVFGPDGEPPLGYVRSIAAANDGGRWVFETSGTPFAFEDLSAYTNRLKKRRLTAEMLQDYLRALGVPVDTEPDWSAAYLVEHG